MKGKYNIFVQNNKLRYDFVISRNITIIRGDSATGKTTLLELLEAYDRDGDSSGVLVKCDAPCVVIGGNRWAENLQFIHNSIVCIRKRRKTPVFRHGDIRRVHLICVSN